MSLFITTIASFIGLAASVLLARKFGIQPDSLAVMQGATFVGVFASLLGIICFGDLGFFLGIPAIAGVLVGGAINDRLDKKNSRKILRDRSGY